jgi:hypothetical protein
MATSKVVALSYNNIQSKIGAILGPPSPSVLDLGYNLTVSSVQVQPGKRVYGQDANLMIGDLNTIFTHQTTLDSGLTTFSQGQLIKTGDLTPLSSKTDTAYANRNTVGLANLSQINSDSYSDGTTWSAYRIHTVTLDWGSNAEFRGWGNLGGFITIGAGFQGGSGTLQTNSWSQLLQSTGVIVLGNVAATQENQTRNGSFPNGGLYNILQNGQQGANAGTAFKILATDANYTGNLYKITITPYGGADAFNCKGFTITATMTDPHTSPPKAKNSDFIDADFTWTVNTYYAFNKSPTASNVTNSIS